MKTSDSQSQSSWKASSWAPRDRESQAAISSTAPTTESQGHTNSSAHESQGNGRSWGQMMGNVRASQQGSGGAGGCVACASGRSAVSNK
ncbi:hypothetical protein [Leptothoe spongobia]|uniref:Uncharacterized protein n=1 Tax=Leptothoe spongobia TAU-MAC 1115 TaxID=1967444 RepID=A0A947GG19_9CYAN|nr:hypothetical protein [Leptothoe spongobia]MBT9314094.1 hypothetical protein [Leptothoe spongobia TAU-MAC 1115]